MAFSLIVKIIAINVHSENKGNSNSNSNTFQIIDNQNFCNESNSKGTWYIDADYLYEFAITQNLPYKNFEYIDIIVEGILNTDDKADYSYWRFC